MSEQKKGYTKAGYPIVWLRNATHEECMKRLAERGLNPPAPKRIKKVAPTKTPELKYVETDDADEAQFVVEGAGDYRPSKLGQIGNVKYCIKCMDPRNISLFVGNIVTYHTDMASVVNALRRYVEKDMISSEVEVTSLKKITDIVNKTHKLIEAALS